MKDCIGGVILYDETINQSSSTGKKIPELISDSDAVPGIKVDTGAKTLAGSPDEKITEGLDGLRERLEEYLSIGAKFTKWRAVINISDTLPSNYAINVNSYHLALYSALSQEIGLVPIVEPEVLMDGNHSIEKCAEVTTKTLKKVFSDLSDSNVYLPGIVLKPNMVLSGKEATNRADAKQVAKYTVDILEETVPKDVPGIAFL